MTTEIQRLLDDYVARWRDREADWYAFPDSTEEGYQRSQHRYIGGGGSGKHNDPSTITAGSFNVSAMTIPPAQGTTSHAHALDEAFFVLGGLLTVFLETQDGERARTVLGPWDCVYRPAGVLGGLYNHTIEPAYVQVILPVGDTVPTEHRNHQMVHDYF